MDVSDFPLVSVIIPIYKKEDTIRRCIDSVLKQTYRNIEIILIDDGSPDACGVICDFYQEIDERVRVIHQKNTGVSVARNKGIEVSYGSYLTFVDADDIIQETFIIRLLQRFDSSVDIVVGANRKVKKDFCRLITGEKAAEVMFLDDNFGVNIWGKMYRRQCIKNDVFPNKVKMGEDLIALFSILLSVGNVVYFSESLYVQIGSKNTSNDNASLYDFYYPIKVLNQFKVRFMHQNNPYLKFAIDNALVRRSIWIINFMENRNIINKKFYHEALDEIRGYIACYDVWKNLSIKEILALIVISASPEVYKRLYKLLFKI